MTRRTLIGSLAGAGAVGSIAGLGLSACRFAEKPLSGRIVGAPSALGHRLRTRDFPAPTVTRMTDVAIVGSGIAGLASARQLRRNGHKELLLLEASDLLGGNSTSGQNGISAYPWGAHYVPLVRNDDGELLKLFEEMDVITGYERGLPTYNEFFLSADPQERLYIRGRWQEGLLPTFGVGDDDQAQYRRFFTLIAQLKEAKGRDGLPLFAIPIARSSSDEAWRALDRISMLQYLNDHAFTSRPLNWYVDYCCRDDYGSTLATTSAWAGLHYFASRNGRAANAAATSVATWPEGNGFFVRSWVADLKGQVQANALVYSVQENANGVTVDYFDAQEQRSIRLQARAAILALPHFVVQRIWFDAQNDTPYEYSPWMVANLTLDKLPMGRGMDLAWDNVVQDSPMLGYVVANHQSLALHKKETVLTYYWPLSHTDPQSARREALARTHFDWQTLVTADLYKTHPELVGHVSNIDVMVWGHGMRRPTPGSTWHDKRAIEPAGPIFIANSDQSGISIFEEAFHRGMTVAAQCSAFLAKRAA